MTVQFFKFPDFEICDGMGLEENYYKEFQSLFNKAINQYEIADNFELKKEALDKMQAVLDWLDINSPPNALIGEFHEQRKLLFPLLQKAYAEVGVFTRIPVNQSNSSIIANIIADMSQDKADELMQILADPSNQLDSKLDTLYLPTDNRVEADNWRDFRKKYAIWFIGGGNSKNFICKNINPTEPNFGQVKVLKVDNRLGKSRAVEQHLRHRWGEEVFTPMYASRQVKGVVKNETVSRTLVVTDLCEFGSVEEHAKQIRTTGNSNMVFKSCGDISAKMAKIFGDFEKAECCFLDAKFTNWLVDVDGNLRLADTKSFVSTPGGIFDRTSYERMLSSLGFQPREIDEPEFDAEKFHSSLLGRNIYAYLTGEIPLTINSDSTLSTKINMNKPIFNSDIGREYRALIQDLTKDPPEERMSVNEAYEKFQDLKLKASIATCYELIHDFASEEKDSTKKVIIFKELQNRQVQAMSGSREDKLAKLDILESELKEDLGIKTEIKQLAMFEELAKNLTELQSGSNDVLMKDFIIESRKRAMQGNTWNERKQNMFAEINKLELVLKGLSSGANKEVLDAIHKYDEKKKSWYSHGNDKKARKIEAALALIPIEERLDLQKSTHQKSKTLFKEIKLSKKIINTAEEFKELKKQLQEELHQKEAKSKSQSLNS